MSGVARAGGDRVGRAWRSPRALSGWIALGALLAAAQIWFWLRLFTTDGFLAHSDLYEQFLPVFLSPIARWSSTEFAGLPVFADPQNTTWYPLHLLFSRVIGSWSWYVVSAYLVAALGAAAYAWSITRSRVAAVLAGLAWPWSEALADLFPHLAMLHGFAWLPWVLFGVEQVVRAPTGPWVALTAFSYACLAISGHPQVSVYCTYLIGFYTAVLWLAESRRLRPLAALAAAFVLGGALGAIQVVPTMDVAGWIARDQVNFSQFAGSFAKKPHELLTVVIPQFCHERREAPSYVGLLPLWLAVVAIFGAWRQWRTWLWVTVAILCLLLGLGPATSLAEIAYTSMPLYDKFRVAARHLALYSFAIIALGAIAAGALAHGRVRWTSVVPALVVAAAGTAVALWYVGARPDLFDFSCDGHGFGRLFPALASDVRVQALIAGAGAIAILLTLVPRVRMIAMPALALVLGVDLLNAQSEPVDWHGYQPPTIISPALLGPSVHAARLRDLVAPQHQRVLPVAGSAVDPVLPGAFARLWQIPSLGGYNPLLPARLTRLAQMDANGSVRGPLLLPQDQVVDLFAVRAIVVPEAQATPPDAVPPDTPLNRLPTLNVVMGPSDCRPKGPATLTLAPAGPIEARAIALHAVLRCADNVPANAPVGRLVLVGEGGDTQTIDLDNGTPANGRLRGGGADANAPLDQAAFPLATPMRVREVRLETLAMPAWMLVDGMALVGTDGRAWPMSLPASALAVRSKWRELNRFSTSRDSDRGRDEDAPHEEPIVTYENLHAQPRAWWVGSVVEVPDDDDAIEVIRFGARRTGEPFDVARQAFVAPGTFEGALPHADAATGTVTVNAARDGAFDLSVEAPADGIVVVSELHHPGWRAELDGTAAEVLRVDHAVMGVRVPAGAHHVTLVFAPASFRIGAAISSIAVVFLAACLAWPAVRKRTRAPAAEVS